MAVHQKTEKSSHRCVCSPIFGHIFFMPHPEIIFHNFSDSLP